MNWSFYIILCTDNTLYAGITNDVSRRFNQHAAGGEQNIFAVTNLNSWFTSESGHNRSSATKSEICLKKLSREEKSRIITSDMNEIMKFLL